MVLLWHHSEEPLCGSRWPLHVSVCRSDSWLRPRYLSCSGGWGRLRSGAASGRTASGPGRPRSAAACCPAGPCSWCRGSSSCWAAANTRDGANRRLMPNVLQVFIVPLRTGARLWVITPSWKTSGCSQPFCQYPFLEILFDIYLFIYTVFLQISFLMRFL